MRRVRGIARRRSPGWRKVVGEIATCLAVLASLAILLLPLIWLLLTSVRPLVEIATTKLAFWSRQITWENYVATFLTHDSRYGHQVRSKSNMDNPFRSCTIDLDQKSITQCNV